jgi:hypothetical protein
MFRSVVALGLALAVGGCSATINPAIRQDAQTAVRVKTALVNDPVLGVFPIEVRVTGGLVALTGRVGTAAQVEQVVALVRRVAGVTGVEANLDVMPIPPPAGAVPAEPLVPNSGFLSPRPAFEEPIDHSTDRRLLAVGGSVRWSGPRSSSLDESLTVGPLVRLGSGVGAGLAIGFGWFNTDLHAVAAGSRLARVRIRPVMAGLGYTVRRGRLSATASLVGGLALNGLTIADRVDPAEAALDVDNSLAWRSGLSFWLDATDRIALNVFGGYLVTRPEVTVLDQGETLTRRLRADTVLITAGMAYKIF